MNRRPKLSLVSNRKLDKRQALDTSNNRDQTREQSRNDIGAEESFAPASSVGGMESEQLQARIRRRPRSSWLTPSVLAKAFVVATTFALTVYILKRRLLK